MEGYYIIHFKTKSGEERKWPVPGTMTLCDAINKVFESNDGSAKLIEIQHKIERKRSVNITHL